MRLDALLSRKDVSRILGIPPHQIILWETDKRRIGIEATRQLMEVYGKERKRYLRELNKARKLTKVARRLRNGRMRKELLDMDIRLSEVEWYHCIRWIEKNKNLEREKMYKLRTEKFLESLNERNHTEQTA
jgi:hypothetical protein